MGAAGILSEDPMPSLTFLNVLEGLVLNGMALCCFMTPYLEGSASAFNFRRNHNKMCFLFMAYVFLITRCYGASLSAKQVTGKVNLHW